MTLEQFLNVYTVAKTLKSSFVVIYKGMILGTDENINYLAVTYHEYYDNAPEDSTIYCYEKNELAKFFKQYENINVQVSLEHGILYGNNGAIYPMIFQQRFAKQVVDKYYTIHTKTVISIPSFYASDLRGDETIETLIQMKKSDGIVKYMPDDKHMMTLFSTMLPVNKSDGLKLEIYDVDEFSFIAKFTIIKKKYTITKYFRFRYLI